MSTIYEEIDRIKQDKEELRVALVNKGAILTGGALLSEFTTAVNSLMVVPEGTENSVVTVDKNIIDITAGLVTAQTIEIPKVSPTLTKNVFAIKEGYADEAELVVSESEVVETSTNVTVGIGYISQERVIEKCTGNVTTADVEYGYLNLSGLFQPYNCDVNPPEPFGTSRWANLRTLKILEDVPQENYDGFIRILGSTGLFAASNVQIHSTNVTGTLTFTGGNPDTFDMEYFDKLTGVWKKAELDVPISITTNASVLGFAVAALPGFCSKPYITDIRGTLGNDADHCCRLEASGFSVAYSYYDEWNKVQVDNVSSTYSLEMIGDVRSLYGYAEDPPEYGLNNFGCTPISSTWSDPSGNQDVKEYYTFLEEELRTVLPSTNLSTSCYASLYEDMGSFLPIAATYLPATVVPERAYYRMYANKSIIQPTDNSVYEIAATVLGPYSCGFMFAGSGVRAIKVHFTDWYESNHATEFWVQDLEFSDGVFYKPTALEERFGDSYIPTGWTVVNYDE